MILFGFNAASEIFHKATLGALRDIPGVKNFSDEECPKDERQEPKSKFKKAYMNQEQNLRNVSANFESDSFVPFSEKRIILDLQKIQAIVN